MATWAFTYPMFLSQFQCFLPKFQHMGGVPKIGGTPKSSKSLDHVYQFLGSILKSHGDLGYLMVPPFLGTPPSYTTVFTPCPAHPRRPRTSSARPRPSCSVPWRRCRLRRRGLETPKLRSRTSRTRGHQTWRCSMGKV